MDRRLLDVSQAGNIDALYALLEDDPHILNYIDQVPFTRTPLHIAILAQNLQFAKEIASLKPSFLTKIDSFGYSPTHLAAEKGQVDILRGLLEVFDPKMQLTIRGKENRTPLHFAVISGKIEVIHLLLGSDPDCILDSTIRNETALHLAVKNNQLDCFLTLLEWLESGYRTWAETWELLLMSGVCSPFDGSKVIIDIGVVNDLLNWKDEEGNTILHLATLTKQYQMIEALLRRYSNSRSGIQVDINSLNGKNLTALDIFYHFPREKTSAKTEEILLRAGAKTTTQMISPSKSPSLYIQKQNYPLLTNNKTLRNLHFGLDIVFATLMVITCLLTATNTNLYPFLVFNMVVFLLSFAILFAASMASPLRKILIIFLATVVGAYVYLVFSAIPSKDWVFFGAIFVNVGAAISMVFGKLKWVFDKKLCSEEIKVQIGHAWAEPEP